MGGINSSKLTLLLPVNLVHNILVPRGIMSEIAQRSQTKIDLGPEGPSGMRQVTLCGTMMANSMASLYLMEQSMQFQNMSACLVPACCQPCVEMFVYEAAEAYHACTFYSFWCGHLACHSRATHVPGNFARVRQYS